MTRCLYTILFTLCLMVPFFKMSAQQFLKLATTTSTYDTGLLDHIIPPFEKKHNLRVHIVSVGTGKAIKLGENGDVDVILVHSRQEEDKFVRNGFGVNRRDLMSNDFVIAGPESDPAGVKRLKNPVAVLKKIYETKQLFVSRGDDSGTYKKELSLWHLAGLEPANRVNSWYLETGQGQGATLRIADEKNSYILIDRSTYHVNRKHVRLKILFEGGGKLLNPYGIIAVNPNKHKHVKYKEAMELINWLTSAECQEMIDDFKIDGVNLFYKIN